MILQIADGLMYIHDHHFIHRNLNVYLHSWEGADWTSLIASSYVRECLRLEDMNIYETSKSKETSATLERASSMTIFFLFIP